MKPIPHKRWRWYGVAAHFICGPSCRFHMATEVGPWLVSTVGEYHPHPDRPMQTIGAGADSFYETYVFRIGADPKRCAEAGCACGLPEPLSWSEVHGTRWATRGAATAGHMRLCAEWAAMPDNEEPTP